MTEYFGFMVDILTGSVEDLHGTFSWKPSHEDAGWFAYAKWFTSETKRNEAKDFTKKIIKEKKKSVYFH